MKKKILLLTASYGTGHVTASKSIGKALAELYPGEIETRMIDFIKKEDKNHPSCFFEKLYNFSMEYPFLWHFTFKASNTGIAHFYFSHIFPSFYKEMENIFAEENPSLCITTHPYWNFLLDQYNRNTDKRKKYICVITDSTLIHNTWISPDADYYMVCDNDTARAVKNLGIDEKKIFVKGFPIDPNFASEISRDSFLREQGLDPKKLTILMVIGLGDTKKFLKVADYLAGKDTKNFQFIIITGKYKNIYDELSKKSFTASTKVVGWTDKMAEFIKSSDLIISKGGGAIVMETLAAGKPVFVPVFTPGQELGNAMLLKKYGYGFVEQDFNKIKKILEEVISKPELISSMKNKIKEYSKPDAAREIAKFAYDVVTNKTK